MKVYYGPVWRQWLVMGRPLGDKGLSITIIVLLWVGQCGEKGLSVMCLQLWFYLQVDIVRVSSVDFQFTPAFEGENKIDAHYVAVFKGFIHPLNSGNNRTAIKVYLIAAAGRAYLYISTTDDAQLKVTVVLCVSVCMSVTSSVTVLNCTGRH